MRHSLIAILTFVLSSPLGASLGVRPRPAACRSDGAA